MGKHIGRDLFSKFLITAAFAVLFFCFCLLPAQKVYAAEEIKPIEWVLTKSDAGVVSSAKSKWTATSGTSDYTMFLYKKGNSQPIAQNNKGSSTSFDFSSALLAAGEGTYYVEGYAFKSYNVLAHYKSDNLTLCRLTINTDGHGSNISLSNIEGNTSIKTIIENSYLKTLGNPSVYYTNDKSEALIGFAEKPKSQMADRDEFFTEVLHLLGGEEVTLGLFPISTLMSISGHLDPANPTVYAVWYKVINNVNVTITPPACGEQTTTSKTDGKWDWNTQTNNPVITIPSGAGYHLAGSPDSVWLQMNNEASPFVGTFEGDNTYRFKIDLRADYGYIFPGDNDGAAGIGSVEGGILEACYNSSNPYGYWLYNSDKAYYEVPLWITGKVAVSHSWDQGEVTKQPTCSAKGERTFHCSGCTATNKADIDIDPNAHQYGDWQSNENEHWKECAYNPSHKKDVGEHSLKDVVTTAPTATMDGEMTRTCTECGWSKKEVISHTSVIGLVDINGVRTDLDPINTVPFGAEINQAAEYNGQKLAGMIQISDEKWESTDGKSSVSRTSPGKVQAGKKYFYTAVVSTKEDYIFADSFTFTCGGNDYDWSSINVRLSEDHKKAYITGFIPDQAVNAASIASASVTGISNRTYNGSAQTQAPVVKVTAAGAVRTLHSGTDYTISYANNTNAGTATMTITGKGSYTGTVKATFAINKAANPMTVKAKTATLKAKVLKKKAQTLAVGKVMKKSGAQGRLTYKLVGVKKAKFKKFFKINAKNGKITVKKKLKKGTYKLTIAVTAAGSSNYDKLTKKVTCKVIVK